MPALASLVGGKYHTSRGAGSAARLNTFASIILFSILTGVAAHADPRYPFEECCDVFPQEATAHPRIVGIPCGGACRANLARIGLLGGAARRPPACHEDHWTLSCAGNAEPNPRSGVEWMESRLRRTVSSG